MERSPRLHPAPLPRLSCGGAVCGWRAWNADGTKARHFLSYVLPRHRYLNPGIRVLWPRKHEIFADAGADVITSVAVFPATAGVTVADPVTIKHITTQRAQYPKPAKYYRALTLFGRNVVAAEGNEWKKHRKITAPAFSERNNKLVWDETLRIMNEVFDHWGDEKEVHIADVKNLTVPIALMVIGTAAFGKRIAWDDDETAPPGHKMTFKEALSTASRGMFQRIILPRWAFGLTKQLRKVWLGFEELDVYMKEMIEARRTTQHKPDGVDLFSALIEASEVEVDPEFRLTNSDVTGNVFVFLIAGHETTAATLAFTFTLLALYPEEQDRLFEHIGTVLPEGRDPTYDDLHRLSYVLAVFYETLRMFPPVISIPKQAAEDGVLCTTMTDGRTRTIPIKKDMNITLSIVGTHYNPRYWEDPRLFRPSRFLGDWNRDAFLPFAAGARSCVGRRFSETEGVAIITKIIQRYRVDVEEEPQFMGETWQQRHDRVLRVINGVTLNLAKAPLVFKKRVDV